jgi:hypothetical protein
VSLGGYLWIVKAREPEAVGLSFDQPRVEEIDAAMEVLDPRPEGLEGGIRAFRPQPRHLVSSFVFEVSGVR